MTEIKRTSLYQSHLAMGARMAPFGGWSMPIAYGSQIGEHHCVRRHAGMFDVSHMTIVDVSGARAQAFLGYTLANDVTKLGAAPAAAPRALYSCMLREDGGVLDDLIAYGLAQNQFRLVVNAATRDKDLAWLTRQASAYAVTVEERDDLAMIAVQGPAAVPEFVRCAFDGAAASSLKPFTAMRLGEWLVARTGYTGEDGLEIMLPAAEAPALWQALATQGVAACGLGARDTLRLEAGLNLYGQDMDESVTPLECGLGWTVAFTFGRNFVGREALERQQAAGPGVSQFGLILRGRGVLRSGCEVVTNAGQGLVTSGSFSPTLGCSIGLARLPQGARGRCEVSIRGHTHSARIVAPPFVRNGKIRVELD
ncbi:MAG TPA: glycine cleavage system aminomethyltransferase GcvT [Gammaproteobacteria bacterium]|jgi:aminomethyltransferase